MEKHKDGFSIERMAELFEVSRSGYYRFISAEPTARHKENERLLEKIKAAHQASRETYGSPRIHAELWSQGEVCSRKRVAKLMRKGGIEAKMKK